MLVYLIIPHSFTQSNFLAEICTRSFQFHFRVVAHVLHNTQRFGRLGNVPRCIMHVQSN